MSRSATLIFDGKVTVDLSEDMIEEVCREYELEHPGRTAEAMSAEEFSDRIMVKINASAKRVQ